MKSTDVAIKVVAESARAALSQGGVASVLLLNISKAFDIINYDRLI